MQSIKEACRDQREVETCVCLCVCVVVYVSVCMCASIAVFAPWVPQPEHQPKWNNNDANHCGINAHKALSQAGTKWRA